MKLKKYSICFLIIILVGCAQKEVADPPVVENISQQDPIDISSDDVSSNNEEQTVIEQITKKEPEEKEVIEQVSSDTLEEDTAVTYPRPVKIKKYEPISSGDSWFLVGGVTGERAYQVFVDPETIESKQGLVESWSKLDFEFTQNDEDGISYKEVQIHSAIDCENKTYSYLDSKFYDGLGRLLDNQTAPYDPQPIVDGTVSSKISDFVCGYQSNRPKE